MEIKPYFAVLALLAVIQQAHLADIILTDFAPKSTNPIAIRGVEKDLQFELRIKNNGSDDIAALAAGSKNYHVAFYFAHDNLETTPGATKSKPTTTVTPRGLNFGLAAGGYSPKLTFTVLATLPFYSCNKFIFLCGYVTYTGNIPRGNFKCVDAANLISCFPDIIISAFKEKLPYFFRGTAVPLIVFSVTLKNIATAEAGNQIAADLSGNNYDIVIYLAQGNLETNGGATKTGGIQCRPISGGSMGLTPGQTITIYCDLLPGITLPVRNCSKYTHLCVYVKKGAGGQYIEPAANNYKCVDATFKVRCSKGIPDPPCCLRVVNVTAVTVTLTFKRGSDGEASQTFTIERRIPVKKGVFQYPSIPDPGVGKDVVQKLSALESDTLYEFRVIARNTYGRSSSETDVSTSIITEVAPRALLSMKRNEDLVTATWQKLHKRYSNVQIKYCPSSGERCKNHTVDDASKVESSFTVEKETAYVYYLVVFDGEDLVYLSPPARVLPTETGAVETNGAMIAGIVVAGVVLIAAIIAVVIVMQRKEMTCFSGKRGHQPSLDDRNGALQMVPNPQPIDLSVHANQAFEADNSEYEEPDQVRRGEVVAYDDTRLTPGAEATPREIEDIPNKEFKQWLLSKHVTESTYKILAKNGLHEVPIFVRLQTDDVSGLRIKPLGQEILIRDLVKSFRQKAESHRRDVATGNSNADAEEGVYSEPIEDPYAELNISPSVIAGRSYTDLRR